MRNLFELNAFRIPDTPYEAGAIGGAFLIPYPLAGEKLRCIATAGEGWDHVSVSPHVSKRTPSWAEMSYAKATFFHEKEVVMQLHVPEEDHINVHPYCLHLWRPHDAKIPLPPKVMV
jgi:hypothetical protein